MNIAAPIKYKLVFSKKGDIVYISHLDLMTLFRRAIRRSNLPFVLTKGFTPRVRISIPKALKLGKESLSEEMILWLEEEILEKRIEKDINKELPEGVQVLKVERI